jgi:radical SAM protein with 4Fe4S-binding SPASM domain
LGTPSKLDISRHAGPGGIEYLATDYSGDILWADRRNPGELDYVIGLGIPFHIDTNGVCLSATAIGKLGQSQLASLNISLDAATDATFRRIRRGAPPLDQVLENVRALVRARAASGAIFAISLGFTLMRSNLAEWPDFLHLSASLGVDSVIARHVEAYTEDMAAESLWHDQSGYNRMRRQIVELGDRLGLRLSLPPAFTDAPERSGHRVCGVAWHSAVVLGNGDVAACCVPSLVMGNLNHNTLEEIWNGPRYQALRRTVNTPQAPRQCLACPMLRLTQNGDSYLFHRILDNKGREPAEAPALLSQPHS